MEDSLQARGGIFTASCLQSILHGRAQGSWIFSENSGGRNKTGELLQLFSVSI